MSEDPFHQSLLKMALLVEPDRQRLARFALEAVNALHGDVFAAALTLDGVLRRVREAGEGDDPVEVEVAARSEHIILIWSGGQVPLADLPGSPERQVLLSLAESLRNASESSDPELLKARNEKIASNLERARAAAAAEMAQLQDALEKKKQELQESIVLAETDSLTGLLNRGAYDRRLQEAVRRSLRQKEALCLMLLDLDKFKEVNDTHGHQYGDEYLKRMAQAMVTSVRQDVDFCCRTGGDEFAIILFAETPIATRVAGTVLKKMDGKTSIGLAPIDEQDTMESLVARADAALYDAKHRGRGQYALASQPPKTDQELAPALRGG